jgi:hypothetical protein
MNCNQLLYEVYLMNLLGHLKLLHERGGKAGEEYWIAQSLLNADDAIDALGIARARELALKGRLDDDAPTFEYVRNALDAQFAPNPDDIRPARLPLTSRQLLAYFDEPRFAGAAQELALSLDALFHAANIRILCSRWEVPVAGRSLVAIVRELIEKAPTPGKIGGDADLLDWLVFRIFSPDFLHRLAVQFPEIDPTDFFYERISGDGRRIAQREIADSVEFGYGMLDGLLSYAALDRRLERIQGRVAAAGREALAASAQVSPDSQEALSLRIAAQMELDGDFRRGIRLLMGSPSSDADAKPKTGGSGDAERTLKGASLGEWERLSQAKLQWHPAAERDSASEVIKVAVETAGRSWIKTLSRIMSASNPKPARRVVVRLSPGDEMVLEILGLDEEREALVLARLAVAMATAGDGTLQEQLLQAELQPTVVETLPAWLVNELAPQKSGAADVPQHELLLMRVCELLGPKPISIGKGDLAMSLEAAGRAPRLPLGDQLLTCGGSLLDLLREVETSRPG